MRLLERRFTGDSSVTVALDGSLHPGLSVMRKIDVSDPNNDGVRDPLALSGTGSYNLPSLTLRYVSFVRTFQILDAVPKFA